MMRQKCLYAAIVALALALLLAAALAEGNPEAFMAKAALLREQIVTDELVFALGDAPAGEAGYAVLLSVSDGATRARVYSASGETLAAAWDNAVDRASATVDVDPLWVKADVVTDSRRMTRKRLALKIKETLNKSRQMLQNNQRCGIL